MPHAFKIIDSPVGKLTLVAREAKLAAVLWEIEKANRVKLGAMEQSNKLPILCETERQWPNILQASELRLS
jgi:methylated-DNA-[protein]-cysteine S-methyltransferase